MWGSVLLGRILDRFSRVVTKREGHPPIYYLDENLPEVATAIANSRKTFTEFTSALHQPKRNQQGFSVKLPIKEQRKTEHIWITDIIQTSEGFTGKIDNKPEKLESVRIGDPVFFKADEISDWMYVDNGKLVGGETIQLIHRHLNEEEAFNLKMSVPFVICGKLNPSEIQDSLFDSIGHGDYVQLESLLKADSRMANLIGKVVIKGPLGDLQIYEMSPARFATYHADQTAMELLLRYGADPKNASEYGSNALHDAAMRGHADIIRLLLKNGADINAKTNCGYTALTIAIRNQNDACANLLVELGSDTNCVDLEGDTLLHHARSLFWTDFFLKAGIAINSQNLSKQTPLHVAITNCQVDKALFLIQQGADTTLRDIQHRKPLFFAKQCLKTADLKLIQDAIETKPREAAP